MIRRSFLKRFPNRIILVILAFLGILIFSSGCTGPMGPPGPPGYPGQDGQDGLLSEVFELKNVDFVLDDKYGYIIFQPMNFRLDGSDSILIYRMSDLIDSSTPVWQLIPRTLFFPTSVVLPQGGELDYDYDFTKNDFQIYAGGTYNLALTPDYITDQTFRIVIIPGNFSNRMADKVDYTDYHAVIKAYGIDDSHVKMLN